MCVSRLILTVPVSVQTFENAKEGEGKSFHRKEELILFSLGFIYIVRGLTARENVQLLRRYMRKGVWRSE